MLRLLFCLRRLPGLSRDEFQAYWRETHAPLVRRHAAVLRIVRYAQLHTLDSPLNGALRASRGGPEAYDGIAELWWQSEAELEVAMSTAEGQRAGAELLEDERRFIDLEQSPIWVATEFPVVSG